MQPVYDAVIVGAGPAGLAAGLYAARAKLNAVIIEKAVTGGQIATTGEVANYPGAILNATGPSLVARMVEQVEEFGVARIQDQIREVDFSGKLKKLNGIAGNYLAKSVIIATGASPKRIGCPGEDRLTGKGVSYCATCDANFFTDLEVFVIGGGDSAVEEALFIARFARKVTIVHRREALRAAKSIQERAFAHPKLEFMWNTAVVEIRGEDIVQSVVFKNTVSGETTEYMASEEDGTFGIFVFVGYQPISDLFKGKVDMDEAGYIVTDANMHTNIPGVFAAGDVRVKSLRQVITAVADGAIAAVEAEKYLERHF